jgi:hypothetical protein
MTNQWTLKLAKQLLTLMPILNKKKPPSRLKGGRQHN